MKYNTVLFDFDGTIADSFSSGLEVYNKLAKEHDLRVVQQEEVSTLRDLPLAELLSALKVPKLKLPYLVAKGTRLLRKNIASINTFEGISEVIRQIRPQVENLAILTSNRIENVKDFLLRHQLDAEFDFIESCNKLTGKAKFIRSICENVGCLPEELVYIGDEERDIKAAHQAGCEIIAVLWGFNSYKALHAENPTHLASEPDEILRLLGL